jgi:Rod binding domain-containing protein
MSDSSSGTNNQYLPGATKTAITGNKELGHLLPQLFSQANQGLSSKENAFYTGEAERGVAEKTASETTGLTDSLARQGNLVGRGSEVEAKSNIARSGVTGTASALSNIQGMDITKQQTNLQNLMAALGMATRPQSSGSTSTSSPSFLSTLGAII